MTPAVWSAIWSSQFTTIMLPQIREGNDIPLEDALVAAGICMLLFAVVGIIFTKK